MESTIPLLLSSCADTEETKGNPATPTDKIITTIIEKEAIIS